MHVDVRASAQRPRQENDSHLSKAESKTQTHCRLDTTRQYNAQKGRSPATCLALLGVLVAAATAVPALDGLHAYTFEDFSREFRRTYATAEVAARRAQFNQNKGMILAHNARNDSWTMTINQLADLSPAEITARRGVSKSAVHAVFRNMRPAGWETCRRSPIGATRELSPL